MTGKAREKIVDRGRDRYDPVAARLAGDKRRPYGLSNFPPLDADDCEIGDYLSLFVGV